MTSLLWLLLWGGFIFTISIVSISVIYRKFSNRRKSISLQVKQAEMDLLEDLTQIDLTELEQTQAGKELAQMIKNVPELQIYFNNSDKVIQVNDHSIDLTDKEEVNSLKTVIVTGGVGFIGTNLIKLLLNSHQYRVVNLDAITYAANPLSMAELEGDQNYTFVKGNITDRELVSTLFEQHKPSGVFHLAAESQIDRSISHAEDFIQTNVVGTYTMLEASRAYWHDLPNERKRLFRFLHVSTDEVFGSSLGDGEYFSEESPYAPNSQYAASKAASDHFVRAFHHTYGLPTIITVCSNNYGPYQFPEKLIPFLILNALLGKPLPVYGDGGNVRDWIYVEDHCNALKTVFEKGKPGELYTIGAHNDQKNISLVKRICSILDDIVPPTDVPLFRERGLKSYSELIRFVADRPGHDTRYAIDSSKITRELGWRPDVGFEAGLYRAIEWYLSNPEWVNQVSSGSYSGWLEKNYVGRMQKQNFLHQSQEKRARR